MFGAYETGVFANGLAYLRLAGGARPLVLFPGLNDALYNVHRSAWFYARLFRGWTAGHTLYIVSRRQGMPPGFGIADMVADYRGAVAEVLERERPQDRRVDLSGVSLGGFLALRFAADDPAPVRRLVIQVSAHRLGPKAPAIASRWFELARKGRWLALHVEIADAVFTGLNRPLYKGLSLLAAPWLMQGPEFPHDVTRSLEAAKGFDLTPRLSEITQPTLVIGGTEDALFPPELLEECARLLPRARLVLIPGTGHNALYERKAEFEEAVLDFLAAG